MLNTIKLMNGIDNADFDNVINSYIESAILDLEAIGIADSRTLSNSNNLIQTAIITYVNSFIDVDNAELYSQSYELQKDFLRRCSIPGSSSSKSENS